MCHHRADLFEDNEIKGLLKFVPWWAKLSPSAEQGGEAGEFTCFLPFTVLYIVLLGVFFYKKKQLTLFIFFLFFL